MIFPIYDEACRILKFRSYQSSGSNVIMYENDAHNTRCSNNNAMPTVDVLLLQTDGRATQCKCLSPAIAILREDLLILSSLRSHVCNPGECAVGKCIVTFFIRIIDVILYNISVLFQTIQTGYFYFPEALLGFF